MGMGNDTVHVYAYTRFVVTIDSERPVYITQATILPLTIILGTPGHFSFSSEMNL